ncbi:MAG: hypothetical protein QXL62_04070 [Nitrososphaerota archaeon]
MNVKVDRNYVSHLIQSVLEVPDYREWFRIAKKEDKGKLARTRILFVHSNQRKADSY